MPRLRLRWEGYRKVHRQVCKRLTRRMEELGLPAFSAYKAYLEGNPREWPVLDSLCGITISRFYRDRGVFDALRTRLLPSIAADVLRAGGKEVLCWSAGCATGEEPYTLQIIWRTGVVPATGQDIPLRIIATDVNEVLLERGRRGRYPGSSLRDLPGQLREAFVPCDDGYSVRELFRENVEFLRQDIRQQLPEGTFHLILCRNLVFTYFDEGLQRETLRRITEKLMPGGILVIGRREFLPNGVTGIKPVSGTTAIFQK
jgi:chemotaxis protein methyltransferase CheR